MNIKMTRQMPIAVDGIHARLFRKDSVYQTNDPGKENYVSKELATMIVDKFKAGVVVRERTRPEPSEVPIVEPSEIKKEETAETEQEEETEKEIVSDQEEEALEDGMRVHEMAKEYNVPNKAILNAAKKLGIGATVPMSSLSGTEVIKIKELLEIE